MDGRGWKAGDVVGWQNFPGHEMTGEISWVGAATANVAVAWSEPGHVPVGIMVGVPIRDLTRKGGKTCWC